MLPHKFMVNTFCFRLSTGQLLPCHLHSVFNNNWFSFKIHGIFSRFTLHFPGRYGLKVQLLNTDRELVIECVTSYSGLESTFTVEYVHYLRWDSQSNYSRHLLTICSLGWCPGTHCALSQQWLPNGAVHLTQWLRDESLVFLSNSH